MPDEPIAPSAMRTVLLLGATGRVGRATLHELDQQQSKRPNIRVLVRRPERLPHLDGSCDIRRGPIEDRAALEAALTGVDAVLLVTGDDRRQVELESRVIEAAQRCGRPRIVKVSAITAGLTPRVSFGRTHAEIEERLKQSGLDYTILRPTFFFQSLELFADPVRKAGRLIAPAGDGAVAFIDVHDIGAIAARVLTETGHERMVYDLTGATALQFDEVATALTAHMGRPVQYLSPPLLAARAMMTVAGGMEWWLSGLVTELFAAIRVGVEARITKDAKTLLGRRPRELRDYLSDSKIWSSNSSGIAG